MTWGESLAPGVPLPTWGESSIGCHPRNERELRVVCELSGTAVDRRQAGNRGWMHRTHCDTLPQFTIALLPTLTTGCSQTATCIALFPCGEKASRNSILPWLRTKSLKHRNRPYHHLSWARMRQHGVQPSGEHPASWHPTTALAASA